MEIALFHSMYGLRRVELAAADRLRAAGHRVIVPDLFDGRTSDSDPESGFALMAEIGWPTIVDRARAALAGSRAAAMIGFSMGVGVISELWPERLGAVAVGCLHAPATVPAGVPAGTPVQLHVGTSDQRFAPPDRIRAFRSSAAAAGAAALVREYPGAGHFFTDDSSAEYDPVATAAAWNDLSAMLRSVC